MASSTSSGTAVVRTALIVSAVVGVVLGLVLLFWPDATLVTIATLFGIALVVAGVFRLIWALGDRGQSGGGRALLAVLGLLLIAAGALVLARPIGTLAFVGVLIGISWLLSGIRDLAFGLRDVQGRSRWLAIVSGVISLIGGVVIIVLPFAALTTFAQVAGILLVVVSVSTLLTLPLRSRRSG